MQQSKFGKSPAAERLESYKSSPNFSDGKFQNQHYTPQLTEGYTMPQVMYGFFFEKVKDKIPTDSIPSTKTNLLNLSPDENILVWFGHSSYFIQIDGKKFLVDPVFSGNASPVPGTVEAFLGTDRYEVADLPHIDYLFITHDHYDHLDYETMLKLLPKTGKVICGLGVGEHLELWGYPVEKIIEKDWHQEIFLADGFTVFTTPARHFSGRGFVRNNTLWMSFVLQTPSMKIYMGGDSGYDTHYAEIGSKYGPIDLAIVENGQYDKKWKYIHNLPEQVVQAALDLKAKRLFPVHSSKFALANHSWYDPLTRVTAANKNVNIPMVTPIIGEKVNLKDTTRKFSNWWEGR
jgi:L-ascorbate metabolism protein UlaG (beta-lactamase superfamily)